MQTLTLAPAAHGQTIFAVGTTLELVGRVHEIGPRSPSETALRLARGLKAESGDLYTVRDPRTGRRADVYADEIHVTETPDPTTNDGTPALCGEHATPLVSDGTGAVSCPSGCEVSWPDLMPEPGTGVVIRDGAVVIVPTDEDDEPATGLAARQAEQDDLDALANGWERCERCAHVCGDVDTVSGLCGVCDAENDARVVI